MRQRLLSDLRDTAADLVHEAAGVEDRKENIEGELSRIRENLLCDLTCFPRIERTLISLEISVFSCVRQLRVEAKASD